MTDPIYAIADIHGHADQLDLALELIERDGGRDAEIVFLGDLVDRGPDSRGVIQRLMDGVAEGRNWHVLRGNHDRMFSRFVRDGENHDARILSGLGWTHPRLGGLETLASYGVRGAAELPLTEAWAEARASVPAAHLDFIDRCALFLERGELLFVHAGIRPETPLARQIEDDLVWIREPFLSHRDPHPWLVVHGHTALDAPVHFGNRVDLDGGTGYGRTLYPAVFDGRSCNLLSEFGRVRLDPQGSGVFF